MSLGHDLPRVPRRYGQWVSAVLFVVMAVLLAGWFWQQKGDRQRVLVIAHPVAVGAVVTADDLKVVDVAGVSDAITAAHGDHVVGRTAAVGLVEGQILTPDMVTANPIPGPGERVVGLQLGATRAPSGVAPNGLAPGDTVAVLAVPPAGDPSTPDALDSPTVLAAKATVASADLIEGAGTRLTLLVPEAVAERVTAYVAAGRVALVQAPIEGGE